MPSDQDGGEGPFLVEERHLLDGICTIVNDFLSMRKTRLEMKERCKELNCLYKISHLMLQNDLSIELFCNEIVNDVVPNSFQYPNQCAVQLRVQLPNNDNSDNGDDGENTLVFSNQIYKDYDLMASMKSPLHCPSLYQQRLGIASRERHWRMGLKKDDKNQKRRGSKNAKTRQKKINNIYIGTLEVGYVDGATKDVMFLQEEQQLLHAIASQVGSCVSKFTREQLVHSMLPPKVALELQLHQKVAPQTFETVSILFTDIVGFTVISSKCSPDEICNMLDRLYKRFDEVVISSQKLLYKIETIGDAYMVVSGLPQRNLPPAATALMAVVCGLAFIEAAKGIYAVGKDGEKIDVCIRAGVHSGMVVAGVVGKLMPRYCLFGDTVNTASRMESNGVKNQVHISKTTSDLAVPIISALQSGKAIDPLLQHLVDSPLFHSTFQADTKLQSISVTSRGTIPVKGKRGNGDDSNLSIEGIISFF